MLPFLNTCYYCHSISLSRNSKRYADGRQLCNECSQHIIVSPENLKKVAQWTLQQIDELGFNFQRGSTVATLISQEKMISLRGSNRVQGFAENTVLIDMFRNTQHRDAHIQVVYGMPTAYLVWVLSHEIGHVLVSQHQYRFASPAQEEGFCQLLALLVCQRSKNPQMPKMMQKEWQNTDPVYGGEFRKAHQQFKQAGFQQYFAPFLK